MNTANLIAWLAIFLSECAFAQPPIIAIHFPEDGNKLLVESSQLLKNKISLLARGRLAAEVLPFAYQQLHDADFKESLRKPGNGISILPLHELSSFGARNFDLFGLPYMFKDRNDVYRTFDGPIGNRLLFSLKDAGWVGMAFWDNTFVQLTSRKPITTVADLKGLKIRSANTPLARATMIAFGSQPTSVPFAEVQTALQRGVVDAAEFSLGAISDQRIYEAQPYVNLTNQSYRGYVVVIDQQTWNALSERNRAALEAAIQDTTLIQRKTSEDRDNAFFKRLEGKVKFASYTEASLQGFSETAQPLYARFLPEYGPATARAISATRRTSGDLSTPGVSFKVWYGTNRRPTQPNGGSPSFSKVNDDQLRTGTLTVHVPRYHTFGTIDSSSFFDSISLSTDSSSSMKLQRVNSLSQQDFISELRQFIAAKPEKDRYVLVYVHGFNNSFEEAAMRAAQLGTDLKIRGAMVMYSWPSAGSFLDYEFDERLVESSVAHLAKFLLRIATEANVKMVHIIAHSMGNRALLGALSSSTIQNARRSGLHFGQIISAAPDVTTEDFKARAPKYPAIGLRTTLYNSRKDLALRYSQFKHTDNRAGYAVPPLVMKDIETIDVSNIDVTFLGHGYYAEAAPVLYDLVMLIKANLAPEDRPRLNLSDNNLYWAIGK